MSDEIKTERLRELVRVITARDFDATQFYMSIPARPDHDADCVIHWAATIIPEQQATITEQAALIQRVTIAANEMHRDNRKGDFELSTLARIDLDGILAALKEKTDE